MFGRSWYGYLPGIEAHFGGGVGGGFIFDTTIYPLGIGAWFGPKLLLGAQAGVGVSGITGHVPVGVPAPLELFIALQAVRRVQLVVRAQSAWLLVNRGPQAQSSKLSFADEHRATLWFRLGDSKDLGSWNWGNGYVVGVTVAEQVGETTWGAILGYSINFETMQP